MGVSLKIPLIVVDDADLVRVSRENPGYHFEREEDGTLTVSPNFTRSAARGAVRRMFSYARTPSPQAAEHLTPAPDLRSGGAAR